MRELDAENKSTKWGNAICAEARDLLGYEVFTHPTTNTDWGKYQYIQMIWAFDMKFDGRHKARVCMLDCRNEGDVYAGFVLQDMIHMCMGIAMMSGLQIFAADVSSAYLNADTREYAYTILDAEFGDGWAGKKVLFKKACYGLPHSSSAWHTHLSQVLLNLGFLLSNTAPPCLNVKDSCIIYN